MPILIDSSELAGMAIKGPLYDTRKARLEFLQDVTADIFITKHALFIMSLLVGDLFVNYRCWVVWGKNIWVVVLPLLLSIVAAGSKYYALWGYTHLTGQSIFAQQRPMKIFFSASLVANALATSLLASRIWYMDCTGMHALDLEGTEHKLTPVVRIVLESGLLNAVFLFQAFMMTLAFSSTSLEIMSKMGTPMCSIVFCIIIFRVGLRRHNRFQRGTSGEPSMSWGAAIKSIGMRINRNTMANPPATSGTWDPPTLLRTTSSLRVLHIKSRTPFPAS
ncbi:hypothetical protein C8T65DRAFT_746773 [Cerioporus squamosus]|nr:hypothetical protein C8T65DRAFT_746773 [Cerioporus squamosus]